MRISKEQVEATGIIPSPYPVVSLGDNWFKDVVSGICYLIKRQEDFLIIAETRKSKINYPIIIKHCIKCLDCGKIHNVGVQDKHQVVRCHECQKSLKNKKRAIRLKKQRTRERAHGKDTRDSN